MNRFWQDAAGILDSAVAANPEGASDLAIVVDAQNRLRIVCEAGWSLDALQREYGASKAYLVTRTAGAVTVDAQSGTDRCSFRKNVGVNPGAILAQGIPHHLVSPTPLLLQ